MTTSPSSREDLGPTDEESWPWSCLDCQATIYHDGDYCLDCESAHRSSEPAEPESPVEGFIEGLENESITSLTIKTSVVTIGELTMMGFGLRYLFAVP